VLAPDEMTTILDTFYDECADAIWQHDGLLNKTIGDAWRYSIFQFVTMTMPQRQYEPR
jgi:adenylate cyclase